MFACSVRIVAAVAAVALTAGVSAQTPDVQLVLARVGEELARYYQRAQSVICFEKSIVQPVGSDFSPRGFGRVTEYELRLEPDQDDPERVKVARQLLKVNGRAPRVKDVKDRSGCTDANPLSPEPLEFLLPSSREEYTFSFAGFGKGKDQNTFMLDYVSTRGTGKGELKEAENGKEDCFSWNASPTIKGRVWIDASTHHVRRVERRFAGMVELMVPANLQRRYNFDRWVTVQRFDTTIQYRTVPFQDPAETMLLPESIDTLIAIRGGLESIRQHQVFSNYRRFLTGGRIVK